MNMYTFSPSKIMQSTMKAVHLLHSVAIIILTLLVVASQFTLVSCSANRERLSKRAIHIRDLTSPGNDSSSKSLNPSAPLGTANSAGDENKSTPGPKITENTQDKLNFTHDANVNKTETDDDYVHSLIEKMSDNKEMLLRTLYVTLGVTGIVVLYFVTRAVWLRRRRTNTRKYKIIAQNGDQKDLEMEPLGDGNDDDDEDYTVFEVNGRKK